MRHRGRVSWVLLLSLVVSCGSGAGGEGTATGAGESVRGGGGGESAAGGSVTATQRAFLDARGTPAIYTIVFADEEIGEGGRPTASPPRRLETWIWLEHLRTAAHFDSGYFVREQPVRSAVRTAPVSAISPAAFHAGMTPDEVARVVGGDYQTEEAELGGKALRFLRYAPRELAPPHTFAFVDGRLASVSVGFQMSMP